MLHPFNFSSCSILHTLNRLCLDIQFFLLYSDPPSRWRALFPEWGSSDLISAEIFFRFLFYIDSASRPSPRHRIAISRQAAWAITAAWRDSSCLIIGARACHQLPTGLPIPRDSVCLIIFRPALGHLGLHEKARPR
jgi:hypothetical protein